MRQLVNKQQSQLQTIQRAVPKRNVVHVDGNIKKIKKAMTGLCP